jgi:hypothetical protein
MAEAEAEQRLRATLPPGVARSMRRFANVRGQRHCVACGHILPLAWPADKETCQSCQVAGRVPRPYHKRRHKSGGPNVTKYGPPIGIYCARWHQREPGKRGLFCDAFPDGMGVPDEIMYSQVDHRTEEVQGDHGLLFVPKSAQAAAFAALIIDDVRLEK